MACWAGARLNTADNGLLELYKNFGLYFGSLIQLLDDLEEFNQIYKIRSAQDWFNLRKSLPFVYTFEVFPEAKSDRLIELLDQRSENTEAVDEIIRLLEESGIVVYLLAEMERYRNLAKQSLMEANPEESAAGYLENLLEKLGPRS